jgi:hypothetical protein
LRKKKAKANDVTELFLPAKIVEQKLRDDGAEQRELAPQIVVVHVPDVGELLNCRVDLHPILKRAAGEGETYTSRIRRRC